MDDIDRRFTELYHELGRSIGIDDALFLNIFSRLYIEPEPISMEDLAKETGYSLASISNSVKMMSGIAPVRKIKKPGSKKVFLFMEKDFLSIIRDQLVKKQASVNAMKNKVPALIKECKDKAKSNKEKARLKLIENYHKQVLAFESCISETLKQMDNVGK